MAKTNKPDLILLDLVLPKMNGFQVLEKIREDSATKDVKVFILSNLGQSGEIDQGFKEGADGYLIKANMTPSQLIKNIEKIFKGELNKPERISEPASGIKKKSFAKVKAILPEEKAKQLKTGQSEGRKILLIEDEEAIAQIYKLAFEKKGYLVDAAKNGAWGVKLSGQNNYDIIIMDMVMPAMNGYDAIKEIRSNEMTKKTPIIILSNSAQDKDVKKALALGASSYLLKSQITPAALVKEAERLVGNR
jgi:CheY-like chemotaxis protein